MNKNYLWNIVCVIFISCIINGIVWIGFHGIPLIGLPEKEEVERVTIVYNNTEERSLTDEESIGLLVQSANLLNYRFGGKTEETPVLSVSYHLKNGKTISLEANTTTLWWRGKSHALKETDVFINVIEGLFFQ